MYDTIPGKSKDEMTLMIGDMEIVYDSLTYVKTMDTIADAATAIIPCMPGVNEKFDKITIPYSYSECGIYIGGKLQAELILYNVTNEKTSSGMTKRLEMFSRTADLIDSTVMPPYEENYISLSDRCRHQAHPFGIQVVVGDDVIPLINETRRVTTVVGQQQKLMTVPEYNWGNTYVKSFARKDPVKAFAYVPITKSKLITQEKKFARISAKPTEKIFSHLKKYAAQHGIILSCTKHGDLLLTRANVNSKPVTTIDESQFSNTDTFKMEWKGRDRYRIYRAIQKTASGKIASQALDKYVQSPRILQFDAGTDVPGNTKNAAEWKRNVTAAQSLKDNSFDMNGYYIPLTDILWQPNTTVSVVSPTMCIPNGYTFLITQTEFRSANDGLKTTIKIIPPSMYSVNSDMTEPWGSDE